MKRKSISAFVLAVLLFTGCRKSAESSSEYFRIVSPYINGCNNGEFYSDNSNRLLFCDFETMRTSYICAKPNCQHIDEDTCSAFGMDHHPVLYGGNIYYFTYDVYMNKDREYQYVSYINKADSDGTNRRKIYTIDGLYVSSDDRMIICGSKIYFTAEDAEFDEYGSTTNYTIGYLCSYDLESGEFENISEIYKGYSSGNWVYGIWNGNIYFHTSVSEDEIDWNQVDISADDVMSFYTIKQYSLNIAEKSISGNDLPAPLYIGGRYYVYGTENGVCLKPENGEDIYIDYFNGETGLLYILNDFIISSENQKCANISTGKVYQINPEYVSEHSFYEPVYYIDGNFILRKPVTDDEDADMTDLYISISESEYIGEEII